MSDYINKKGTYEVVDEEGNIIETFRLKATAEEYVKFRKPLQRRSMENKLRIRIPLIIRKKTTE